MIDLAPYAELKIAPRAVFDSLSERRTRVRFMVPTADGDYRAVTWGAFASQIRRMALAVRAFGLENTDRAAVFAPNRVEWISAALAIQAAGGVMVPVYPASTAEQAAYVLSHSDAKVVFVDTPGLLARLFEVWSELGEVQKVVVLSDDIDPHAVAANLVAKGKTAPDKASIDARVVGWTAALAIGAAEDEKDGQAFERTMHAVSLDQPGVMLYTSGTSGNPKGVPLTHRNVGVNGHDWLVCNGPVVDEGAVDLLWLPMSHIFGFGEACLGNTLGWLTYLADPASALTKLTEVRPHVFMSVPAYWEKLAMLAMAEPTPEAQRQKLMEVTGGHLSFCLSGGAGLKREVKELFHANGLLIIEGYGLTECSPTLTLNRPDAFRFDSVGKVLPSVEVKLAEDGEILAKGPSVFLGYHKQPEATKEAFNAEGWFLTGDIGRFTEDGFLQIIDRKKDILVTAGGKNVPPANIEILFRDDPYLLHVVVYGDGKRYLTAGVWVNDAAVAEELAKRGKVGDAEARKALIAERIELANQKLPSYETLKKFVIVDRPLTVEGGLLTATLKVRRKKVYEAFREDFEALYA